MSDWLLFSWAMDDSAATKRASWCSAQPKKAPRVAARAEPRHSAPPPAYTEATLVRQLERLGVGRPSTYASIVDAIQKKKYVEKGYADDDAAVALGTLDLDVASGAVGPGKRSAAQRRPKKLRTLAPTAVGARVAAFLRQHFGDVVDERFTADMEADMDRIASGDAAYSSVVSRFYALFEPTVARMMDGVAPPVRRRLVAR